MLSKTIFNDGTKKAVMVLKYFLMILLKRSFTMKIKRLHRNDTKKFKNAT